MHSTAGNSPHGGRRRALGGPWVRAGWGATYTQTKASNEPATYTQTKTKKRQENYKPSNNCRLAIHQSNLTMFEHKRSYNSLFLLFVDAFTMFCFLSSGGVVSWAAVFQLFQFVSGLFVHRVVVVFDSFAVLLFSLGFTHFIRWLGKIILKNV